MSESQLQQLDPEGDLGTRALRRWDSLRAAVPWLMWSALSGVLLCLSFPPADLGFLAFVALTPMLVAACRAKSYRWAALCGAVAAEFGYLPPFAWVASVSPPGWFGLAQYAGLCLVAMALVARFLQKRFPHLWPLLAAATWVGLELVRARLGAGFPWLLLGYTQYRFGPLLQWAAGGGVYTLSFVVVLVGAAAAALVLAALRTPCSASLRGAVAMFGAALMCLLVAATTGAAIGRSVILRDGPTVGVVQQNIPRIVPEVFAETETAEQLDDVYREVAEEIRLAAQLSAELRGRGVQLLAWPETTVQVPLNLAPDLLVDRPREIVKSTLGYLKSLGADMGCHFLVGAPTYFPREAGYVREVLYGTDVEDYANSAVMFSPQGEFVDRYDKIRLVPFGEYIPLRDVLPFLQILTPISREITPGTTEVIFELPGSEGGQPTPFGALICYEDVFPDLVRRFRLRGARFLVNLTDEGWYYIPGELRQHLAMAVFRAVETRTTVVRAANTGISCFIDPLGKVYARLPTGEQGTLSAPVVICDALTPYVRHGDWFAVSCLMLSVALPVLLLVVRRPE